MTAGGVDLGSARGSIEISIDKALANLGRLEGALNSAGQVGSQGLGAATKQMGGFQAALGGIGSAIGGFFVSSGVAAANFEQAMDGVGASLGGVGTAAGITEAQFKSLNDEALRIGSTTSASATDAAQAMDLMAKAGVSIEAILNGGAQAAVNISEATGEGLQQSAQTMSSVLNLFKDTGITAAQAADQIVTGMNASNASMAEFQTGIGNLAPVIAATGMTFDQSAALIATFNAMGLSAAEVGTSLTSAFNALLNPTSAASTEIANLAAQSGVTIDAFDDLTGEFVGYPALFDQVAAATAGMTEEQAAASLELIFGADAADVMALAMKNGGDPVRALTEDMQEQGSAAASAAQRMDNLEGDVEGLSGSVEGLGIKIGDKLLPEMREGVQLLTKMVNIFANAPAAIQNVTIAVAGLAAVFGTLSAGGALASIVPGLGGVGAALAGLALPITIAVAALALFGLAYKKNFGGLKDNVKRFTDTIGDIKKQFDVLNGGFAGQDARDAVLGITNDYGKAELAFRSLGQAIFLVTGIDARGFFNRLGKSVSRFPKAFGKMASGLDHISDTFKDKGFKAGIEDIFGTGGRKLLAGFGDALGAIPKLIGEVFTGLKTGIEPIDKILNTVGRSFIDFGRLIQEIGQGDFGGALVVFERLVGRFGQLAGDIFDALLAGVQAIPWGDVWNVAVSAITAVAGAGLAIGTVLVSAGIKLIGGIASAVGDLYGWIKGKLFGTGGGASTVAGGAGGPSGNGVAGRNESISFGDVLVEAGVRLIGGITSAVGRLKDWITGKLFGGGGNGDPNSGSPGQVAAGDVTVPLGTVLLDGLADLGSALKTIAGNLAGWLKTQLGAGGSTRVVLDNVIIDAIPTIAGGLFGKVLDELIKTIKAGPMKISPDLSVDIEKGAYDITTNIMDALTFDNIKAGGMILGLLVAGLLVAPFVLPALFAYKLGYAVLQGVAAALTGIAGAIKDQFTGFWSNLFSDPGTTGDSPIGAMGGQGSFATGGGLGTSIVDAVANAIESAKNSIVAKAEEWWGDIKGAITGIFPAAPDWATALTNPFLGIKDQLMAWIEDQIPSIDDIKNLPIVGEIIKFLADPTAALFGGDDIDYSANFPRGAGGGGANPLMNVEGSPDRGGRIEDALGGGGSNWSLPALDLADFIASITEAETQVNRLPGIIDGSFGKTLQISSIYATSIYTTVSTYFGMLVGNVRGIIGTLPDIVVGAMNDAGAAGAAAAAAAGTDIGTALADAIRGQIPNVRSASFALGAAAEEGANSRLERNSPPKVFVRMGNDIGETLAGSMLAKVGRVASAGSALAAATILNAPNPSTYAAAAVNRTGTVINNIDNRKVFALKTAELVRMMNQAENGDNFANSFSSVEFN